MLMGIPEESEQERERYLEELNAIEQAWDTTLADMTAQKADVEERLKLWQGHRQNVQRFSSWLVDVEKERMELQVKHSPIKKVEKVLKQVKVSYANINC